MEKEQQQKQNEKEKKRKEPRAATRNHLGATLGPIFAPPCGSGNVEPWALLWALLPPPPRGKWGLACAPLGALLGSSWGRLGPFQDCCLTVY